jgi:hypothetical protein
MQRPFCDLPFMPTHWSVECILCTILSHCVCDLSTMKQWNSLYALRASVTVHSCMVLSCFLMLDSFFLCSSFFDSVLPSWPQREGPTGLPNVLDSPLLLKEMLDNNDLYKVFLVVPLTEGRHLKTSPIW